MGGEAQAAGAKPVLSPSGLALPNPTLAMAARICAIEPYPHLLQRLRELCGAGLLMAPGQAERLLSGTRDIPRE